MQLSGLAVPIGVLGALLAHLDRAVSQQPERHTISGDDIAVYNLVGVTRIEGGSGSAVVVELTRGGRDLAKLRVETGPVRGRETLRVIYPDDDIVYHGLDFDGNTTLDVREDGTFNDREGHRSGGGGHRVRISGSGRGRAARAAGRYRIALHRHGLGRREPHGAAAVRRARRYRDRERRDRAARRVDPDDAAGARPPGGGDRGRERADEDRDRIRGHYIGAEWTVNRFASTPGSGRRASSRHGPRRPPRSTAARST